MEMQIQFLLERITHKRFHITEAFPFMMEHRGHLSSKVQLIGQEVKTISGKNLQKGKNRMEIDLADLNSGVYFCKINSNENLRAVKLIKQ
ncbi:MAG: T9SS type A sorting domain-containing protein [Bacteroidetes bacterium]|nr:T9SS type A sorting domain-containing protein [Bacteroidota bacterium]